MATKCFCPHFHIACGEGECWVLFDKYGKTNLVRPCVCGGVKRRCDFKKIGGRENASN